MLANYKQQSGWENASFSEIIVFLSPQSSISFTSHIQLWSTFLSAIISFCITANCSCSTEKSRNTNKLETLIITNAWPCDHVSVVHSFISGFFFFFSVSCNCPSKQGINQSFFFSLPLSLHSAHRFIHIFFSPPICVCVGNPSWKEAFLKDVMLFFSNT